MTVPLDKIEAFAQILMEAMNESLRGDAQAIERARSSFRKLFEGDENILKEVDVSLRTLLGIKDEATESFRERLANIGTKQILEEMLREIDNVTSLSELEDFGRRIDLVSSFDGLRQGGVLGGLREGLAYIRVAYRNRMKELTEGIE